MLSSVAEAVAGADCRALFLEEEEDEEEDEEEEEENFATLLASGIPPIAAAVTNPRPLPRFTLLFELLLMLEGRTLGLPLPGSLTRDRRCRLLLFPLP